MWSVPGCYDASVVTHVLFLVDLHLESALSTVADPRGDGGDRGGRPPKDRTQTVGGKQVNN